MARGWESKAVESQQEQAVDRGRRTGPPVAREDAQRQAQRATLMLARVRAEADLKAASAPAHRSMLEQAITDLDSRLAALENSQNP